MCIRDRAQGGVGGGAAADLGADLVGQAVGLVIGGVGAGAQAAEDEQLADQGSQLQLAVHIAVQQVSVGQGGGLGRQVDVYKRQG